MLNNAMERSDVSEQPLVSVIVSSFNYERYIKTTLQSILDQTIPNFEIVVIDDGSTDGSLEIVRSFGDPRIRLFVNERNIGLVPTYNRGLRLARGEYIAYCDSDDWIEPRKLEEQIAYFRANPGVDIVATHLKFVDAEGQRHPSAAHLEATYNQLFDLNAVDTWAAGSKVFGGTIMLPRAVHLELGPRDETMAVASDFELHARAAATGRRFGLVAAPLMAHRVSDASASARNPLITFLEGIYVFQKNILPMFAAKSVLHLITPVINDTVIGANHYSLSEDQRDRLLALLMSPTRISDCAAFKQACLNGSDPALLSFGRRIYASLYHDPMNPLQVQIRALNLEMSQRDAALSREIAVRDQAISARDNEIAARDNEIAARDNEIAARDREISARDAEIAKRCVEAESLSAGLATARKRVIELDDEVARTEGELRVLRTSASWRLTEPFRRIGGKFPWLERLVKQGAKFAWWTVTLQLRNAIVRDIRTRRGRRVIAASGALQPDWYLAQHSDVLLSGIDPISHYLAYGAADGRDPNPFFDTDWYLAHNKDVRESGVNPLVHYLLHGAAEGRDPSASFDTDWYVATNADVRPGNVNPLVHFLQIGRGEGRRPMPPPRPEVRHVPTLPAKYDVVILANFVWQWRRQRPQQLALQFARNGHRVFYVVASPTLPAGATESYGVTWFSDRIGQVEFPESSHFDRYNHCLSGAELKVYLRGFDDLVRDHRIADAVVHVDLPSWVGLATALRERWRWPVIYDCMDEWADFPGIGRDLVDAERELVRLADGVTVSGAVLEQKWQSSGSRTVLVRNAADSQFFLEHCKPNDRFSYDHPVIGYYGAIADWLDVELVAELAQRNPQWQFVLAGDIFVADLCGLDRLRNVKLVGLRPYEDMPPLLWHFDVCIIPFKLNESTHAVDPVKLYEYLAGGKPVVAVPLREIEIYRDVISLAEGADQFTRAIAAALADDNPAQASIRRAVATRNQWSDRYASFEALTKQFYPQVSIAIVTYNNCELTGACIDSILANTTHPNYEVIVVDNCSSDDTADHLRGIARRDDRVKTILNADNRGFAAATNQGLRAARGDVLVILNNDVVVPRGWLRGLLRCLDDPGVGLVGPVTNSIGNEARIAVGYDQVDDMHDFARDYMQTHRGQFFDIAVLAMFCLAMRRDTLEKIGFLDEGFAVGMFEDDDYANRARVAGLRVVCTEESFVHHAGQAAFKKLIETGEYKTVWDHNKARYEAKWGSWTPHRYRAT